MSRTSFGQLTEYCDACGRVKTYVGGGVGTRVGNGEVEMPSISALYEVPRPCAERKTGLKRGQERPRFWAGQNPLRPFGLRGSLLPTR